MIENTRSVRLAWRLLGSWAVGCREGFTQGNGSVMIPREDFEIMFNLARRYIYRDCCTPDVLPLHHGYQIKARHGSGKGPLMPKSRLCTPATAQTKT